MSRWGSGALHTNGGLDLSSVFDVLVQETSPAGRWRILTTSLAKIGLTEINYAFLDLATASRMEARGDPGMSTMRPDWIARYSERKYDMRDDAVAHVRDGKIEPMLWTQERIPFMKAGPQNYEVVEAGLRSGLAIPLAGPFGTGLPGAGIMLGSGFSEAEFLKLIGPNFLALNALAHLFHAGSVGELVRLRHKVPPLTVRERDCLRMAAIGSRNDEIGHKLGIATVTVEHHLRAARRKLGAKTTSEALARAMLYQQIDPV